MDNKNKKIKTIMKNTNIKILFLSFILLSVFSFAVTAQAAGDSLYVSPTTSTINAGSNITASAVAGTSGDKICAVQGTIVFNNLTCQSITLASGMMAQTSPTCSSPSFIVGIPKCVTTDTTLFTVSSIAGTAGKASISFSGVKLIGVGVVAGTASESGNYTVNATTIKTTPKNTTDTTQTVTQPIQQTTQTATPTQQTTPNNNLSANVGAAGLLNSGASKWFNWILIILVILIVIYAIYYFATKRKKK